MDASYFSGYAFTAPTLNDSMPGNPGNHYFQIVTHNDDPLVFWVSQPDSGYSTDDLAPNTPVAFAGIVVANGLRLSWFPNTEVDLSRYALYRGTMDDFVPNPANLIAELTDTTIVDTMWSSNISFYKLSAKDIHENESGHSLIGPNDIVPTLLQAFSAFVDEDGVEITWQLAEIGEQVRFYVLRAEMPDGEYRELVDPRITAEGLLFSFRDTSYRPGTAYRYRVDVSDEEGRWILFETQVVAIPPAPLALHQNHPNPFNPKTTISFSISATGPVDLSVYDAGGKLVRTLVHDVLPEGLKEITWDGKDTRGNPVSSGVYLYRLTVGNQRIAKKMILLK